MRNRNFENIESISSLILKSSGIKLNDTKASFVKMRIERAIRELGVDSIEKFFNGVEHKDPSIIKQFLVESLTTHTTSFFRERTQFEFLSSDIRERVRSGEFENGELSVWSAACSTGEELYSALFVMKAAVSDNNVNCGISAIGTDISHRALSRAESGLYHESELFNVPPRFRHLYMTRSTSMPQLCRVSKQKLPHISWFRSNLMDSSTYPTSQFDYIFLRNVLIYFKRCDAIRVVTAVSKKLKPNGCLFLGHTEKIDTKISNMKLISPSVYRRVS